MADFNLHPSHLPGRSFEVGGGKSGSTPDYTHALRTQPDGGTAGGDWPIRVAPTHQPVEPVETFGGTFHPDEDVVVEAGLSGVRVTCDGRETGGTKHRVGGSGEVFLASGAMDFVGVPFGGGNVYVLRALRAGSVNRGVRGGTRGVGLVVPIASSTLPVSRCGGFTQSKGFAVRTLRGGWGGG